MKFQRNITLRTKLGFEVTTGGGLVFIQGGRRCLIGRRAAPEKAIVTLFDRTPPTTPLQATPCCAGLGHPALPLCLREKRPLVPDGLLDATTVGARILADGRRAPVPAWRCIPLGWSSVSSAAGAAHGSTSPQTIIAQREIEGSRT